jgi:hypothetical protein
VSALVQFILVLDQSSVEGIVQDDFHRGGGE